MSWTYERVYVVECLTPNHFYVGTTLREMFQRQHEHEAGYEARLQAPAVQPVGARGHEPDARERPDAAPDVALRLGPGPWRQVRVCRVLGEEVVAPRVPEPTRARRTSIAFAPREQVRYGA